MQFLQELLEIIFTPTFSNQFRVAFNNVLNIRENAYRVLFESPNKVIQVYLVKKLFFFVCFFYPMFRSH